MNHRITITLGEEAYLNFFSNAMESLPYVKEPGEGGRMSDAFTVAVAMELAKAEAAGNEHAFMEGYPDAEEAEETS